MSVRTSVVLPAPRSPDSVTKSPACSELAMSIASRRVACSSGSATEKLDAAEARAAVARAERVSLEPIEHLILYIGRDAGSAIGHREYDGVPAPLGGKRNDLAAGRKAHGIG